MTDNVLGFLLTAFFLISATPVSWQEQNQPSSPTLEQTIDFLNNHRHGYYAECNSTDRESNGHIVSSTREVSAMDIKNISSANGALVIQYSSGESGGSGKLHIDMENFTDRFMLHQIKLPSLVVEKNPKEAECNDPPGYDTSTCRPGGCPTTEAKFTIDSPYWVRLDDGHVSIDFGLPVMTKEEGERVKTAILHLIELSGGKTKEVF